MEEHLQRAGPFRLGSRFSRVDIYLLITASFSNPLARGESPAIEECIRRSAERTRIAPTLKEHLAGLERIVETGVPR